jgi:hypothetical protein
MKYADLKFDPFVGIRNTYRRLIPPALGCDDFRYVRPNHKVLPPAKPVEPAKPVTLRPGLVQGVDGKLSYDPFEAGELHRFTATQQRPLNETQIASKTAVQEDHLVDHLRDIVDLLPTDLPRFVAEDRVGILLTRDGASAIFLDDYEVISIVHSSPPFTSHLEIVHEQLASRYMRLLGLVSRAVLRKAYSKS